MEKLREEVRRKLAKLDGEQLQAVSQKLLILLREQEAREYTAPKSD